MTKHTGWPVAQDAANNGSTPKGTRLATGGLIAPTPGAALGVRRGVLVDGLMTPVVTGTGSMAYEVRAFRAVTMTTTANGPVVVASDGVETVATTASPGANSRIDVIWVRQHLVAGDGGSDTDTVLEFGVTQGAVSASPAVPSIPSGALALARATVTAGVTTTAGLAFEQAHDWTVANGGIIPDGTGGGLWFNGTDWVPLNDEDDTGWVTLPLAAGHTSQGDPDWTPQVRRIGNVVHMRGLIKKTSGSFSAGNAVTVGTMATQFRPTRNEYAPMATNDPTAAGRLQVGSNGMVQAHPSNSATYVSVVHTWMVD